MSAIIKELQEKGYCVVDQVLNESEVETAKNMFYNWQKTIPNHDMIHSKISPHGIYKFHEIGHQEHAWYIRTRPKVIQVFKDIWKTDSLITGFDGSCYIPKEWKKKDNIWTHTDQAANNSQLTCYQSYVSLTDNQERTIVLYEGSHNLHQSYFKNRKVKNPSANWQLINHEYLESIKDRKRVLHVKAGQMVIWDSRTFHQNQYGKPNSEERMVQYICYLPKSHLKNTSSMIRKRAKYFEEKRTTSHWPAPIRVNSLQPQHFGNTELLIDYTQLQKPNLEPYLDIIKQLI